MNKDVRALSAAKTLAVSRPGTTLGKTKTLNFHRTALCLIIAMLAAAVCFAQVGTGRLDGTVTDATGGVMPGAKVTAIHQATQSRTESVTNADGAFVFPSLQPGIYSVEVEMKGFRTSIVGGVEINISTALTQKFKLEVGD